MTIKSISKVDSKSLEQLRSFCQSLKPRMELDVSNYAKGRRRLWLFHESNLRNTELTRGFFDKRLWDFCQRAYPGCNIGLLTYGGEGSTGLIDWHRDHSYAQPIARTINLGESTFGYDLKREGGMNFPIAASCGVSLRYASHTSWFGFTQQHPFGSCFYRSQQAAGYVSHRIKIN